LACPKIIQLRFVAQPSVEASFQFTVDVADRYGCHFTLWKFSDSYVVRERIRRNVPAHGSQAISGVKSRGSSRMISSRRRAERVYINPGPDCHMSPVQPKIRDKSIRRLLIPESRNQISTGIDFGLLTPCRKPS
jgi:hypothetical protein